MNLIVSLQKLATGWLTTIATVFDFLGQLPFFVLLFAFFFLIVNKTYAFKYWLAYASGFIFGTLLLKNVINRPRPFEANESLFASRNLYGSSFPNASSIMVSQNSTYIFNSNKLKRTRKANGIFVFILTLICLTTGLTQLYIAKSYLLDVFVGLALGFIISLIIIKFVKIKKISLYFYIVFPILTIFLLCFSNQLFTNNFENATILEFIGISMSILLGSLLEAKFIKYQNKNNLIFTSFKLFLTLIILIGYYYFCYFVLPGIVFFSFLKYFIVGLIITLILPLLFKKLENYFYVFAKNVSLDKVVMSSVSTCEKKTEKVAKDILSYLMPGDTILLSGDLGAGKSVIVRSILKHAGVKKAITSPTFVIVNNYQTPKNNFYHFDMYRIEDEEEVVNIGFEEILDDKTAIKFIEWPEKVTNYLPKYYKKLTVVKLGKTTRNIILENIQGN